MPDDAHLKYLSIRLDDTTRKVIASFSPEGDTAAITPDALLQAINAAGFGGYNLDQKSIDSATAKYNAGTAFRIVVGEAQDGEFSIRIDAHFMAAHLSCTLPRGGTPIRMKNILQEAENKGIAVPLDLKAIEKTLLEGGEDILIASGKPPEPGIDGKFEILIPSGKKRSPRLDERGLANFRELGEIVTIRADDALMRRILPTNGEPGQTVTGKTIPVKPGKNVAFAAHLDGAYLDPQDQNLLRATISGCPVVTKDGVAVEPVYSVKNVDLRTGNISYDGTVHVSGDVTTDMSIKATGDIHVDGTVENALLEAGGDVVIKGGIIGGSELHAKADKQLHATIICKGSCTARFVQNAHISAGNGIFILDVAMLSELTAEHQIIVGDQGSRKGDIIGGITRATMLVKAKNIGSSAAVKTLLIVGANKQLHERHSIVQKGLEAAEQKLVDIIKLLDLAQQTPGRIPPESEKMAEATRNSLTAEIETLREEEMALHKEIDLANRAQVIVEKHVFGGTEISMGLQRRNMTEDKEGGTFQLNEDGELIFA